MSYSGEQIRAEAEQFLLELTEPDHVGNDIVNFIKKLQEWAALLNLDGIVRQGLDIAYHATIEVLIPKLRDLLPAYAALIMETVAVPLLRKFHDAYLHVDPAPTT